MDEIVLADRADRRLSAVSGDDDISDWIPVAGSAGMLSELAGAGSSEDQAREIV